MKILKAVFLVTLCCVALFSIFNYIAILRERQVLLSALEQIKQQVNTLETDRASLQQAVAKEKELEKQLSEENKGLKEDLKESQEKAAKYNNDFNQAQKAIEELNSQLVLLKDERDRMMMQFADTVQERDKLKVRVSSVAELKKAMKELRKQMSDVTHEIKKKAKTYIFPKTYTVPKARGASGGNRGFITKNGTPTYAPKIKIKVEPALKEP